MHKDAPQRPKRGGGGHCKMMKNTVLHAPRLFDGGTPFLGETQIFTALAPQKKKGRKIKKQLKQLPLSVHGSHKNTTGVPLLEQMKPRVLFSSVVKVPSNYLPGHAVVQVLRVRDSAVDQPSPNLVYGQNEAPPGVK